MIEPSSTLPAWVRRPWVWALVAALAIGLGVVALRYAPWLRIEHVTVNGNQQVSSTEVLDAAQVSVGEALVNVPLDTIEQRVESLDAVASADATRDWPDGIVIAVRERHAVGYVRTATGANLVGSDATAYREVSRLPTDLPELVGLTGDVSSSVTAGTDAAGAAVFTVAESLPRWLQRKVARIEADGARQVRLLLDDGVVVTWGGASGAEQKATVIGLLRQRRDWGSGITAVDVSAPDAPALGT